MSTRYRVMEANPYDVMGSIAIHTIDLDEQEANEMCQHLESTFPDLQFWSEPYEHEEPRPRRYNTRGVVDGWEDMFDY